MRNLFFVLLALSTSVNLQGQGRSGGTDIAVAGAYVRAFGGDGIGIQLQVSRVLGQSWLGAQHTFGGHLWYAQSEIATARDSGDGRTLLGIGVKWQTCFAVLDELLHPYIAVPVQFVQSRIPDRVGLQQPGVMPIEDRVGNKTGLGAGVEIGTDLRIASAVSLRIGGTALYHTLFDGTPIILASFGLNLLVPNSHANR